MKDAKDTLAKWLRRRPAKPIGSPRVGSNPTGVVLRFTMTWLTFDDVGGKTHDARR